MADFSETCQKTLKSIKQFLEKANAKTPEVDQRLESVNEVAEILSSLIQDEVVGVDQRWPEFARNLCKTVLFGDWIRLITMACHSTFFNGLKTQQKADETSQLSPLVQKLVEEITGYLEKCRAISERNDNIIHSLIKKVRNAKAKKFQGFSDEDIRTLQLEVEDMESDLKTSKKYLDSAYSAFDQLKSQISKEQWFRKVKVAAFVTGCAAAVTIGGVVLNVSFSSAKQTGGAVKEISSLLGELGTVELAALGIGSVSGATSLTICICVYIYSFLTEFDDLLKRVAIDLRRAQREYEDQEIQFNDKLKERMKR